MKNFIKTKLHEALSIPPSKLPQDVSLTSEVRQAIDSLTWSSIILDEAGNDGENKLDISVKFKDGGLNFLSSGINFTIQLIHDTYYQPHLFMATNLQGLGLAPKIFKAFIMDFGHIYVGKGRILNPNASKVIDGLANDPDFETLRGPIGILIMKGGNPDRETLIKILG